MKKIMAAILILVIACNIWGKEDGNTEQTPETFNTDYADQIQTEDNNWNSDVESTDGGQAEFTAGSETADFNEEAAGDPDTDLGDPDVYEYVLTSDGDNGNLSTETTTDWESTDDFSEDNFSNGGTESYIEFSNDSDQDNSPFCSDSQLLTDLGLSQDTPVVHYDGTTESLVPLDQAMNCCAPQVLVRGNSLPDSLDDIGGYKWFWMLDYTLTTSTMTSGEVCYLYTWNFITTDTGEINQMKEAVNSVAAEILSYIPSGAGPLEKAQVVHDQLIMRLTYDQSCSMPYIRGIYCLATGNAVCAGYARAFAYLMEQAGEEVRVVRNENHAWNEMNGMYFDVTWDDPDNGGSILNDYFATTYDYMVLTGHDFTTVY